MTLLKPDVITLDLEMPRMDGFTFLRILMAKAPTPVIVVSSYSQRENVFKALDLGALDFVPKPERLGPEATEVREEILQKVLLVRSLRPSFVPTSLIRRQNERRLQPGRRARAVGRAVRGPTGRTARRARWWRSRSSTGGPSALLHIFSQSSRPPRAAAFVVAQHMPDKFTRTFAERLDKRGPVRTVEASDGDLVVAATGFVCPGRKCMELVQQAGSSSSFASKAPAAERPLRAERGHASSRACAKLGIRCVGVILTGHGRRRGRGRARHPRRGRHRHRRVAGDGRRQRDARRRVRAGVASEVLPLPAIGDYLAKL